MTSFQMAPRWLVIFLAGCGLGTLLSVAITALAGLGYRFGVSVVHHRAHSVILSRDLHLDSDLLPGLPNELDRWKCPMDATLAAGSPIKVHKARDGWAVISFETAITTMMRDDASVPVPYRSTLRRQ